MENKEILNSIEIVIKGVKFIVEISESNLKEYLNVQINYKNSEYNYNISEKTLINKYYLFDFMKFINNFDFENEQFLKVTEIIKKCLIFDKFINISVMENICNTLNLTLCNNERQIYYTDNNYNIDFENDNNCDFKIDMVLLDSIYYKIFQILNSNDFENVNNDFDFIKIIVHSFIKEWIYCLNECNNINSEYFQKYY